MNINIKCDWEAHPKIFGFALQAALNYKKNLMMKTPQGRKTTRQGEYFSLIAHHTDHSIVIKIIKNYEIRT